MALTYADKPWLKKYDKGVPASLDYPDVPFHHLLRETVKRVPNQTAMITTAKLPVLGRQSHETTYREIDEASDAMAAALVEMGVEKGDRVAIVMPNCVAFAIAFFAISKVGGVVAAANPTYPDKKLEFHMQDSGARVVITLSLFYESIRRIRANTPLEHVVVANYKDYLPGLAKLLFTIAREKKDGHYVQSLDAGDFWFHEVLQRYRGQAVDIEVSGDDLLLFQYTGGTTGVSKAAMSQHKAIVANMLQQSAVLSVYNVPPEKDIYLGAVPMFHVYGLVTVFALGVYLGSRVVLIVNARDTDEVVECIDHYRPTLFPGVPALYNSVNNHPRVQAGEIDMTSLRFCISGSAPLPAAVKEEFERLSKGAVREGFGMSETPTASHVNPALGENRTGSIGLPLPDMEMKIVSLEDEVTEVPVGEIGELLMRGPNLMLGYHNRPEETAKALREIDGVTWLYTGDIARMDEDGYFYIVDRKKDMVLIGGFNVYPTEVENALLEHEAVLEVGVAGIPHPDKPGQETLKAWVAVKPGHQVSADELIAHAQEYLAGYSVPRRIEFIDEIPKTAVGKTLRRELVAREAASRKPLTEAIGD